MHMHMCMHMHMHMCMLLCDSPSVETPCPVGPPCPSTGVPVRTGGSTSAAPVGRHVLFLDTSQTLQRHLLRRYVSLNDTHAIDVGGGGLGYRGVGEARGE